MYPCLKTTRRKAMALGGSALAGALLSRHSAFAQPANAPASTVAVAKCTSYGPELTPALSKMFDQIGGLGRIVAGKTVAMKINLTGSANYRLGHLPAGEAHWTHPAVIGATIHLMHRAGAKRVRLLESSWSTADPLEETMLEANWDPQLLLNAGGPVEMENTNWLGQGKQYHKFTAANGGHMWKEYWLNHSYEDCDVFVSIAKMKEHATAGVTLSMKNLFGITPCTIYGEGAGEKEPTVLPRGGRSMIHSGHRKPPSSFASWHETAPAKDAGGRVPRVIADLVSARPIDLAIIDGIASMAGGEGPWNRNVAPVKPGLLVVGTNCVNTDAVGMALMNFDPMADRGRIPFERSDNTLRLAEEHGVGTRDLRRIEVVGDSIQANRFDFRSRKPVTSA